MLSIYIDGERKGESLTVPLSSCTVIFVLRYCELTDVKLVLVPPKNTERESFVTLNTLPENCVSHLTSVSFMERKSLPVDMAGCDFPALKDEADNFVRCGLCSTLRFIVLYADRAEPKLRLRDILGFRGGTLRSCAEVSGWTRLCELDIPQAVETTRKSLRSNGKCVINKVPVEVQRLEEELNQPPCHHNNDKLKQDVLRYLRKSFSWTSLQSVVAGNDTTDGDLVNILQTDIVKSHCLTRFKILKDFDALNTELPQKKKRKNKPSASRKFRIAQRLNETQNKPEWSDRPSSIEDVSKSPVRQTLCVGDISDGRRLNSPILDTNMSNLSVECQIAIQDLTLKDTDKTKMDDTGNCRAAENGLSSEQNNDQSERSRTNVSLLDSAVKFVHGLTIEDIELKHIYLEGIDLTLCDLLIFVYIYYYLECLQTAGLSSRLACPSLHNWFTHMMSLAGVNRAMGECGMCATTTTSNLKSNTELKTAHELKNTARDQEIPNNIKYRSKEKCRPIKPDVANALEKIKSAHIVPAIGRHPCGEDIHLSWGEFPAAVRPFQGESPRGRGQDKCEQIENLVSAVIKISHPGDVIVDFCCGGGHLGIVIAYMLPECKVFLIDNKEDSLMRAKERTDKLRLSNVTLFQCNLEYFNGGFDIGVCLHGCGVATDMVLQKCLDNMAAFVVCPCCYGKVQNTHLITYPRSQEFREARLTPKEYVVLGHAADQTEIGIEQEEQGRYCSNLVDTDRGLLFESNGYTVTLCSLQPLTCTTKNNLLIGVQPRITT